MTAFDNLRVGTRLGGNPKIMVTTTPKRVPLLYSLIRESETHPGRVVISRGSTLDNAGNLSSTYLNTIVGVYEGTRLAAQELYGEMLDDVEGRRGQHLGCELLAERIKQIKPKIHICGHIHSGYGHYFDGHTHYFNAAVLNERYLYSQLPWHIDWNPITNEVSFL
jgi:hypothetical protein